MTIKLLKKMDIPDAESHFEISCPACRSQVAFELSDAKIDYCCGYPDCAQIKCPACGCRISVGLTSAQKAMALRDKLPRA